MKILVLVGSLAGQYSEESLKQLARVWLDEDHKVFVKELAPEFEAFVEKVRDALNKRLANPKTPIFCLVGKTETHEDGTVTSTDAIHSSSPSENDFLETLRGDAILWASDKVYGGYEVDTGACILIEE